MGSDIAKPGRELARKGILVKAIVLLLISFAAQIFKGFDTALVIFIGGAIAIVTDIVFVFFAFRFSGACKNTQVVQSFKKGNKAKILLTVLLLFVVFQRPELQRIELLVGYVIVLLAHFPVMIFLHQWRQRG
ncbi:MAG: ATP synthase subunit I [Aestuariibacter sp.]